MTLEEWKELAKYSWSLLIPLVAWIFSSVNKRADNQDKRMDSLEKALKEKADNSEMDRQRDNVAKIFDELRDVRKEMAQGNLQIMEAIHSKFPGRS